MHDAWSFTYGPSPVLVLEERPERGRRVYARWWRARPGGRGYWAKRAVGEPIRDDATGRVLPEPERQVLMVGAELHDALRSGRDPRSVVLRGRRHLTLRDGLAKYLEVGAGAYATDTRHRQGQVRLALRLEEVLGPRTPWIALGPEAAPRVWRALAARSRTGAGQRLAERTVGLLGTAAAWLRSCELISAGPTIPAGWRRRLRVEWEQITGTSVGEPKRPRYTIAEVRSILRQGEAPSTDPRLRLALSALAGPELRLGATVTRVRRSDLDLSLGEGLGYGTLRVRGRGSKGGVTVALDPHGRAALDYALTDGHLAELERAYREHGQDYALSPAGRMVDGRYPAGRRPLRAVAPSTLRLAYRALEAAAGVPHRPGRGWHALRRSAADAASDAFRASEPAAALDRLGGWSSASRVREELYLDREGEDLVCRTHVLRARLRAELRGERGREAARPASPASSPRPLPRGMGRRP